MREFLQNNPWIMCFVIAFTIMCFPVIFAPKGKEDPKKGFVFTDKKRRK
jgi:hypothetical protein